MSKISQLIQQLSRKEKSLRKKVKKAMLKAASRISLPIFYEDIIYVSSGKEFVAASGVLSSGNHQSQNEIILAFLFLDISNQNGIEAGFYTVRIIADMGEGFLEAAELVDLEGNYIQDVSFTMEDPAQTENPNDEPTSALKPVFESWERKGDDIYLSGSMPDGRSFMIAIEAWL